MQSQFQMLVSDHLPRAVLTQPLKTPTAYLRHTQRKLPGAHNASPADSGSGFPRSFSTAPSGLWDRRTHDGAPPAPVADLLGSSFGPAIGNPTLGPAINAANTKAALFDEVYTQNSNSPDSFPTLWEGCTRLFELFRSDSPPGTLYARQVSALLQTINEAARALRKWDIHRAVKSHNDAVDLRQQYTKEMVAMLEAVATAVLAGRAAVTRYGAMRLLSAYGEVGQAARAFEVWQEAQHVTFPSDNPFNSAKAIGALLIILTDLHVDSAVVESLYEQKHDEDGDSGNLRKGMVYFCLKRNQVARACRVFGELVAQRVPAATLAQCHGYFIAHCKDVEIATQYFSVAMQKGALPYRVPLYVNVVAQFIGNVYESTRDLRHVTDIYLAYGHAVDKPAVGIYARLHSAYFDVFFTHYPTRTAEAVAKLREVIRQSCGVNEESTRAFLNVLLSRVVVWNDGEIISSVREAYDLYQVPRDAVSVRIYLNSLGKLDVSDAQILHAWDDLLRVRAQTADRAIVYLDWSALAAACFGYRLGAGGHNPEPEQLRHVLETAGLSETDLAPESRGQMRIEREQHLELFVKLWKLYASYTFSGYDLQRAKNLVTSRIGREKVAVLSRLSTVSVADVPIPECVSQLVERPEIINKQSGVIYY